MSCGLSSPSAMTSPRVTPSPSKTLSWRHFGISSSYFSWSSPVMTRRRLPLVSLPKLTTPVFSARIAGSFLERDQRARGQRVHGGDLGVREGRFLALGVQQFDGRTQVLAAALLGI